MSRPGSFPAADSVDAFERLRRDEARLRPGVDAILARLALAGAEITRFSSGSLPVYAVGAELVLKVYPPCWSADFRVELAALRAVQGRLPIATPRVEMDGGEGDWSWILMARLAGVPLAEAWPEIPEAERGALMETLGEALAALHALPSKGLEVLRPDWPAFLREQAAGAAARQRRLGLAERWAEQIDGFLAAHLPAAGRPGVLLHTEVMREHLFVTRTTRGWSLSGLCDFEPAMIGAAGYELASVGVFVTAGEAALLRRLLRAYGLHDAQLSIDLQRACLAYGLVHRYANFPAYLARVPPPAGASTLDELARTWWAL